MGLFDLKIVNGLLVPGDGSPGRPGELAVRGGRIAAIDTNVTGGAATVLDAGGHIVCPGFIDLHTHCVAGLNENIVQSGVTLAVGGNCGFSPLDMEQVAASCPGSCDLNLAMLIGHNDVRIEVMGNVDRKATAAEMQEMLRLVERAMSGGAIGFSTGLTYVPGNYTGAEEVAQLAKVVASHGGYYCSHMRDEGEGLLNSIRETVETGREAGLRTHISHLKVRGCKLWGLGREALKLLDRYTARGLDVTQDQYPYTASCGRIYLLFPAWAQEGGASEMRARLDNTAQRARLKEDLIEHLTEIYDSDGERVVISEAPDPKLSGRSLADLARNSGRSNKPDEVAETVLEITSRFPSQKQVCCVFHGMSEDDVKDIMRHPRTAIGSDGWAPRPDESRPHPRLFGTFPRVLGHYAREQAVLSIWEAIRRMTGLPAQVLGLKDRGLLHQGAWADITVFDRETVIDRATFEHPKQYPLGIDYVLVNGRPVIDHGRYTGELPGMFVARP